jgi:hypothetical protein
VAALSDDVDAATSTNGVASATDDDDIVSATSVDVGDDVGRIWWWRAPLKIINVCRRRRRHLRPPTQIFPTSTINANILFFFFSFLFRFFFSFSSFC